MTHDEIKAAEFFILDKRDNVSIAVFVSEVAGFNGYTFYKTNLGFSINPTKVGRGFIALQPNRFDFTIDYQEAFNHSDQTK